MKEVSTGGRKRAGKEEPRVRVAAVRSVLSQSIDSELSALRSMLLTQRLGSQRLGSDLAKAGLPKERAVIINYLMAL